MSLLESLYDLLIGLKVTVLIFGITLICAVPLGFLVSFCAKSKFKIVRYITNTYILIVRGTPLMLQLIIIFYLPGIMFGIPVDSRVGASIVAFIINYTAYFAEIFRSGLETVDRGQYEAGRVLGFSKWQLFKDVILLQVIKITLPPLSNETITLVKDTSLARIIGVVELIKVSQNQVTQYVTLSPLFYAGVFYLIFNFGLTVIFKQVEIKLKYFEV